MAPASVISFNEKAAHRLPSLRYWLCVQFTNGAKSYRARKWSSQAKFATPSACKRVGPRWGSRIAWITFPAQLSGGEQQRVAIARAIAKKAGFCCATSPQGAARLQNGRAILKLPRRVPRTGPYGGAHYAQFRVLLLPTHDSGMKGRKSQTHGAQCPSAEAAETVEW